MMRRQLLRTVAAGATAGLTPIGTTASKEPEDDIAAVSRDRVVRFEEDTSNQTVSWTIENRHTGDEVFTLDFARERVAHSYVTDERVFVVLYTLDPVMSSRTVE